jgi:hypothetical protein
MRKKLFAITCASALAFAMTFAVSCKEDDENVVNPTVPPELGVTPLAAQFTQAGGTYAITITGNVEWEAFSSANFVTTNTGTGNGNATLVLTAEANEEFSARTATVTVRADVDGVTPQVINITQLGKAPSVVIDLPAGTDFPAEGGTGNATLTANVAWETAVTYEPAGTDWLSLNPDEGEAGQTGISVTATANPAITTRTATITVTAPGHTLESPVAVTVTQAAFEPAINAATTPLTFASIAGSQEIAVDANIEWIATITGDAGISIDPNTAGTGDKLTVTATDNAALTTRAATITISATNASLGVTDIVINVTQEGSPFLTGTLSELNDFGDTVTLEVNSAVDFTWTAEVDATADWLTAANDAGLKLTATINPFTARNATVTIKNGDEVVTTLTVTQATRSKLWIILGNNGWGGTELENKGDGIFEFTGNLTGGWRFAVKDAINEWPYLRTPSGNWEDNISADQPYDFVFATSGSDGGWSGPGSTSTLTVNLNTKQFIATLPPPPAEGIYIGATIWAKYNINEPETFASDPEDPGKFYQFQKKVPYPVTGTVDNWPAFDQNAYGDHMWPGYDNDSNDVCPNGWKIPTDSQVRDLVNRGYSWAAVGSRGNTVAGGFFGPDHATATIANPGKSLFIPAAGSRNNTNGNLFKSGESGYVHSANPSWGSSSNILVFDADGTKVEGKGSGAYYTDISIGTGATVRCIK